MLDTRDPYGKLATVASVEMSDLLGNDGATITLWPTMSVRVTVKGPDGAPLPDAQVYVSCVREMISRSRMTDRAGQVLIEHLYQGDTYRIGAHCSSYFSGQSIELVPGSGDWKDNIEIVMDTAARVQKGKVVDEDGNPVAGVTITSGTSGAISDENGEFVLKDLPDSRISVHANKDMGYGTAETGKDTGELVITMRGLKK